jgi:tellurite methyltransferase
MDGSVNSPLETMETADLLLECLGLFAEGTLPGPVLDLACGDGHNGIFLAERRLEVICCDVSIQALDRARALAAERGVTVSLWQVDFERPGINPLPEECYGAILVFRYLHRPLFPCIRKALRAGGLLVYETFTLEQTRYGRPRNPDHLLRPGELHQAFVDWEILHSFEGVKENPRRAAAQLVCRKPTSARGRRSGSSRC